MLHKLKKRLLAIEMPREDRTLMMICVGISFFFWLLVKLSQVYETGTVVNVLYAIPPGKAFVHAPPSYAEAGLKGTGWQLIRTYSRRKHLSVRYLISADNNTTITGDLLKADISKQLAYSGVNITYVRYTPVSMLLEANDMKVVPISFKQQMHLAKEYHFTKPVALIPDSVAITGPASLLKKIRVWPTELVQIDELKASVTLNVKLSKARPELRLATQSVKAIVSVEQMTTKELFLPVTIKNAPSDSLRFFPDRIKATCVIGISAYDKLDASDFSLVVDLAQVQLGKGNNTAPIIIETMPEGIEHIQLSKKSVEFLIIAGKDQ